MKHTITVYFTLLLNMLSITGLTAQDQTVNKLTVKSDIFVGENVPEKWGLGSKLHFQGVSSSNDPIWMAKYTPKMETTELRINISDSTDPNDRLVVGATYWENKDWHEHFVVNASGKVGIGISHPSCPLDVAGLVKSSSLEVAGTIRSKEVKIEATGWSDFVFEPDYKLPCLNDVEKHIKENKHLPDIPSEKEVLENGVNVVEMQAKLLQKIEELTLYVIEQNKKIKEQDKKIKSLESILSNK